MTNNLTLMTLLLLFQTLPVAAQEITMTVTASAYNSLASQTTSNKPALAAWGDVLKPGMKAVAVSRDLIKMGLTHNTLLRIKGFEGEYRVMDKMNKRWTKKIDIYMGLDLQAAKQWGKQKVVISWSKAAN